MFVQNPPSDAVTRVQFIDIPETSNSTDLLVSSWDGSVRLYDSESCALVALCDTGVPVLDVSSLQPVTNQTSSGPDALKFVAGDLSGRVIIGDLNRSDVPSNTVLGLHKAAVRCISTLPGTNVVFSGSWDKTVKMWDMRSKSESQKVVLPGKVFAMSASDASGSPERLVICDSSKTVSIYDSRNLAEPEATRDQVLKFQLRAVDCFSDGKGYAVSSVEGRVAWEYFDPSLGPSGSKKNYAFKCHREKVDGIENIYSVNAVAFHPTLGSFATGGGDGGLSVWDGYHKKRLWKAPSPFSLSVSSLSFSRVGSRLAIGLGDDSLDSSSKGQVAIKALRTEDITKRN